MKPTLKQIFDFGLELVDKEVFFIDRGVERSRFRTAKKYSKAVTIYVAIILYNYNREELHTFLNISKNAISIHLHQVRKIRSKQDLADELYDSLNILYGTRELTSLDTYTAKLLPIFANENNFNTRSPEDLNKLEKWLINRLYEIENK